MLFATGLDPERSTVFAQSHVTAHAEAAWLLVGRHELRPARPDDPVQGQGRAAASSSRPGLFTYPVLMAGDILLYQTDIVPIGDDQRQHLELARDVAERFNSRFGETFVVPRGRLPGGRRADHGPAGADEEDVDDRRHRRRARSADRRAGRDPEEVQVGGDRLRAARCAARDDKPGITNLIDIMSVATGESPEAIEARSTAPGYGQFKEAVGEAVVALVAPVQERYRELRADEAELRRLLAIGADKARDGVGADAGGDVRAHGLRSRRLSAGSLIGVRPTVRGGRWTAAAASARSSR